MLKLDGERVVDAMPDIGYLHSGFEKIGEHLDYNQYVTVTDRMNYISPMANNVAWHHAVETLLGIELTPRCKYIRVIISELARISDHCSATGAMGLDTGAFTFFLYAFYQREKIYDIFETLCGARFTNSYTRVGGVMHDITPQVDREDSRLSPQLPRHARRHGASAESQSHLRRSHQGRRRADPRRSDQSLSDRPVARASGVTRDLRKDEPYLAYADFDFQVCCATAGDCFARYYVRMAEMRESLKIIQQAVENLPAGPVNVWPTNARRCRTSSRCTRRSKARSRISNW